MRVAVTGTPGTGKTTAVGEFTTDLAVVHLNDVIREEGLHEGEDDERGSFVADLAAIEARYAGVDDLLVESHLAHHLEADRVVVLRCEPAELETRLRERGEPAEKARENAESEALDVILVEAVEAHGRGCVYELDTTNRTPAEVADALAAVRAGEREPSAGEVDYTDYLTPDS